MALKSVTNEILSYIPKCERENKVDPFTVFYRPMTKELFDKYAEKLYETKRNKVISHGAQSGQILFKETLAPDVASLAFIKNALSVENKVFNITVLDDAVKFLLQLPSEIANEIEQAIRGASSLDEDEEKTQMGNKMFTSSN